MTNDETKRFVLVRDQEGTGNPVICYRSGATAYQELFADTMLSCLEWRANSLCSNLKTPGSDLRREAPLSRLAVADIQIDGQSLINHWEWRDFKQEKNETGVLATLTLENKLRPVKLDLITGLDGNGFVTRQLRITNCGDKTIALSKCDVFKITLNLALGAMLPAKKDSFQEPMNSYSIGYCQSDNWCCEGDFQWQSLEHDQCISIKGNYNAPRFRPPFFIVKDNNHGPYYAGCLSWSGGWCFEFETNSCNELLIRFACDGPAPLRTIEPGESIETPKAHFATVAGNLDEVVHAIHNHLRTCVFSPPKKERFGLVEGLVPPMPGSKFGTAETCKVIDEYAALGCELFFLDAIWFYPESSTWTKHVGSWQVSKERYPDGLDPIREYTHEKGMLFGLWMEPERIAGCTPEYEQQKHLMTALLNNRKTENLDLANPEAAAWMEDSIDRVIGENKLDFFRLDYNTTPTKDGFSRQGSFLVNNQWRAKENLYRLLERLRNKYPEVIFENCASGGGRCDPGILRYFDHTWITDWRNAPRTVSIFNGMTMFLPPERTEFLCGTTQDNNYTGSLDFHWRLALFGQPSIGIESWYNLSPNPFACERIRHFVDIYRDFVRPFRLASKLYHHTPVLTRPDLNGWGILELVSEGADRAVAALFRLRDPADNEIMFRFKGLNPGNRYRLTFDNSGSSCIVDGYTLRHSGVRITLDCPLTSELILVEALDQKR